MFQEMFEKVKTVIKQTYLEARDFLKLISWIVLGLGFLVLGGWFCWEWIASGKTFYIVPFGVGLLSIICSVWILKSIKIIGPDEMAVYVWLGEPIGFRDSGPHFVLWLFADLEKFPKQTFRLDYADRKVITRAGYYEKVYYGSQEVLVDGTVYLNFPRDFRKKDDGEPLNDTDTHPLIKILRNKIPRDEEGLKKWTEEIMISALRSAFGRFTWMEAVGNIEEVRKEAEKIFVAADSPLIEVGFSKKGIKVVVPEIRLPEQLANALIQVDKQRLEAEAARFEAQQTAQETIRPIILGMAEMYGKNPEEIQKLISESPELQKTFLEACKDFIARQMAIKGQQFFDVRVQGAEGLEKILLNALTITKRIPPAGFKPTEKSERELVEEAKKIIEKKKERQTVGAKAETETKPEVEVKKEELDLNKLTWRDRAIMDATKRRGEDPIEALKRWRKFLAEEEKKKQSNKGDQK